jgi:hypothetical protein
MAANVATYGIDANPAFEEFPQGAILRWTDILPSAFGANELHFTEMPF